MDKVAIVEVDCTGVELNRFIMETSSSKKGTISKSRIYIMEVVEDEKFMKVLAHLKIFDDGKIELVPHMEIQENQTK